MNTEALHRFETTLRCALCGDEPAPLWSPTLYGGDHVCPTCDADILEGYARQGEPA